MVSIFIIDHVLPFWQVFAIMDMNKRRGKALAKLFQKVDKKQVDLAKELGVSEATISRWLSGKRGIEFSMACQIASLLNVSLKTLAKALGHDVSNVPDDLPPNVDLN